MKEDQLPSRALGSLVPPKRPLMEGKFYALIIGISAYQYQPSLEFPVKDAQKIRSILNDYYAFHKENIVLLKNPDRTTIIDTLSHYEDRLKKGDSLLIFYAGHGHWEEKTKRGYWLPVDAKLRSRAAWISNATLKDILIAIDCQHILIISDSCFSGAILSSHRGIDTATPDIKRLYNARSRRALTSGVKEKVPDRSIFFKKLSRFLKTNKNPFLTATDLFAGIRNKVIAESKVGQKPQYGEVSDTGDEGGDFIFIKKGNKQHLILSKPSPFDKLLANPRIRKRYKALQKQLGRAIPPKSLDSNLLLATWNIRKLGGRDFGGRTQEALAYIATIISRFDIVAIQEIYGDFKVLDDLKIYLGEHWEYVFSDTSIGLGGADYRLGYFYDKRKVAQGGMISDLMLPSTQSRDAHGRFFLHPCQTTIKTSLQLWVYARKQAVYFVQYPPRFWQPAKEKRTNRGIE